jgi:hypothetical protein
MASLPDKDLYLIAERQRAAERRRRLDLKRMPGHGEVQWALTLSGGGIRSATFCLGVLQGLSKAHAPHTAASPGHGNHADEPLDALLPQFDYLSTVSGGGYVGSFFGSLFVRGRLNPAPGLSDEETARQAYCALRYEPPGRMHRDVFFDPDTPGQAPLAWLRENGRYMAPTGSGDMVYAMALAIRAWFGMHYVLGTVLLTVFALLSCLRAGLVNVAAYGSFSGAELLRKYQDYEESLLAAAMMQHTAWWSSVWWADAALFLLWLAPCAAAYWLTHPPRGRTVADKPGFTLASSLTVLVALGLGTLAAYVIPSGHDWTPVRMAVRACAGVAGLGALWYWATTGEASISSQRVTLTRLLARGLVASCVVAALALVDTAAQSLYLLFGYGTWPALAGSTGVLVWLVRKLAPAEQKAGEKNGPPSGKWRIPTELLLSGAGFLLLFLVATLWRMMVLWLQWRGGPPHLNDDAISSMQVVAVTAGVGLLLTLVCARFPGFLNLSTLQGLYSARLTRAYLGASNGERLDRAKASSGAPERSAAEPMKSDYLDYAEYYSNPCGPLHLINVCLNQNVDPAEQLVQRDRKGRPMVIRPSVLDAGERQRTLFAIDGKPGPAPDSKPAQDDVLGIGEWIGVSGAAFSTGLGRQTTVGSSLLMALANVRLGRWWRSGNRLRERSQHRVTSRVRALFKTQAYLFDEMFGQFYGTRRRYHYLSDGGHFENTGIYELLRSERKVKLIVACDCGCDPDYEFEDLANLIRLARIDFAAEIVVNDAVASAPMLEEVFGTVAEFSHANLNGSVSKCALLLHVFFRATNKTDTPDMKIVLLKPRLIDSTAADLRQYQARRSGFPQEPTTDQFYDEAQWESYRKLGLEIASRVFTGKPGNVNNQLYRASLWDALR